MLTALSINSTLIRMATAFRRASTPYTPMQNIAAATSRYIHNGTMKRSSVPSTEFQVLVAELLLSTQHSALSTNLPYPAQSLLRRSSRLSAAVRRLQTAARTDRHRPAPRPNPASSPLDRSQAGCPSIRSRPTPAGSPPPPAEQTAAHLPARSTTTVG